MRARRLMRIGFGRPVALCAVAALATATLPSSAAADESFPSGGEVGDLAAEGDLVVWERKTPAGWQLTERRGSATRNLRAPAAANYAGVDVGRDARGRIVAVYSRCTARRHSCDLYRYRFSSRRETPMRRLSTRRCDELSPSIWRGVVAFGRDPRGARRGECEGGVYARGRRSRDQVRRLSEKLPTSTDIDRRGVVFSYDPHFEDPCCGESKIGGVRLSGRDWKVYPVSGAGGRQCGDSPCQQDLHFAPVLDGGYLYWRRSVYTQDHTGEGISRLTFGLRPPVVDFLQFRRSPVFTVDGGRLFLVDQPGSIRRLDQPAF